MINAIGKKDSAIGKIDSANSLLYAPYASPRARRYPLSYVFSGFYYWGSGGLSYQDSNGHWWSTAAYSDRLAYDLLMNSSGLNPQNNSNKANGFALRYHYVF